MKRKEKSAADSELRRSAARLWAVWRSRAQARFASGHLGSEPGVQELARGAEPACFLA